MWHVLGPRVEVVKERVEMSMVLVYVPQLERLVVVTYQLAMIIPQAELRKFTASSLCS